MGSLSYCDLCGQHISWSLGNYIDIDARTKEFNSFEVCIDCWQKEENWPQIHQKIEAKTE